MKNAGEGRRLTKAARGSRSHSSIAPRETWAIESAAVAKAKAYTQIEALVVRVIEARRAAPGQAARSPGSRAKGPKLTSRPTSSATTEGANTVSSDRRPDASVSDSCQGHPGTDSARHHLGRAHNTTLASLESRVRGKYSSRAGTGTRRALPPR